MAFQLSPGVRVREIDLTNIIPAVSTSIGGFAGYFRWGPMEDIVTVSNEKELAQFFGTPDNNPVHTKSFFTAASFLKYSSALRVVRAVASNDTAGVGYNNANIDSNSNSSTDLLIKNKNNFDSLSENSLNFSVAARYPGELGNSLLVVVMTESAWEESADSVYDYRTEFDAKPRSNEVHVLVLDEDGLITGSVGSILEKWQFLSTDEGEKTEDGSNNYYFDVINERSNWIYFGNKIKTDVADEDSVGDSISLYYSLAEGTDLETFEESGIVTALDLFSDSESVDIDLLFSVNEETFSSAVGSIESKLVEIADSRKDLVALISPPESITTPKQGISLNSNTITTTLVEWGGLFSSSYVVLDSTSVYVYDKYNDKYRWIPASGHVAGLCANTDEVADPWYSPAGLNRGVIRGVLKVAYNPNKTRRDELYKIGINPIVSFTGQGIVLFGDKTALSRPSAFDRINVRRLFLVLEKAISTASRFQLFEFNDEFTRAQFRSLVEPFLREVQGRRGITDFLVVCDESNNTGEIIDRNEFVADIYIKPARSINFITLNFIATRTGADFTEIIGLTSN